MKTIETLNPPPAELPRYQNFCNIAGQIFSEVTVLYYTGVHLSPQGKRTSMWFCQCSCGKKFIASGNNLKRENTKTCGCSRGSHKMSDSPEWEAWSAIIQRCKNPRNPGFKNYGGRGISVCKRWEKFENFIADMGIRPEGHSIDRTNNNGDYEPSNCKWVLNRLQHRNKRSNRLVTIGGSTRCISEWSEITGVSPNGLKKRIKNGWSEDRLLLPPDTSCYNRRKNRIMKPEQQRIAIAETLGWDITNTGICWHGVQNFASDGMAASAGNVPDYVNDWSTRPAMLALLESRGLARHIVNNVCVLMARPAELSNDMMGWNDSHLWMCLSVPQPVFAEAFLVTLNLWKS